MCAAIPMFLMNSGLCIRALMISVLSLAMFAPAQKLALARSHCFPFQPFLLLRCMAVVGSVGCGNQFFSQGFLGLFLLAERCLVYPLSHYPQSLVNPSLGRDYDCIPCGYASHLVRSNFLPWRGVLYRLDEHLYRVCFRPAFYNLKRLFYGSKILVALPAKLAGACPVPLSGVPGNHHMKREPFHDVHP